MRPDGTVKVLDFGLAQTLEGERRDSEGAAAAVTLTNPEAGIGPGTPAYMSPEQARGGRTDKRTDIWAFGCVLYEMLTGRRPFAGDSTSEVVARILEREPDFHRLPSDTPAAIERLLRRCLEKDPQDRLRDIGDARLELRDALAPQPERVSTPRVRPYWRPAVATVAAAVLTQCRRGVDRYAIGDRARAACHPVFAPRLDRLPRRANSGPVTRRVSTGVPHTTRPGASLGRSTERSPGAGCR